MSASEEDFRRLVDEYLDGVIGAEDMEELNRLLESNPGSVDHFVEAAVTHGLLREEAVARLTNAVDRPGAAALGRQASGGKERRSATRRAFRAVRRRHLGWLIPFVVAAAVLLFALSLLYRPQRTAPPAVAEATGTDPRYPAERVTSEVPVRAAERHDAEIAPVIRAEEAGPARVSEPLQVLDAPETVTPAVAAVDEELLEIPEWPGLAEKAVEDQAPPETETSRPVARLAAVDGNVYYKRAGAGRWFKATEGIYFQAGDVLDTWFGKAQVDAGEGCTMACDRKTVMRFGEGRVRVRRGLLFCRFDAGAERVEVVTDDGSVRHLGTKFVVRVGASGTTVIVGEGSVELGNEEGRVTVGEGHMSRVRKGGAPSQPRKADVAREFAWVQPLLPKGEEEEEPFAALSITLINADTDEPMRGYDPIPEGAVILLSRLPTRNLNIRVNVRPAVVGSVRVDLNHLKGFQINADTGQTQTKKVEEAAPYSLGDGEGDYSPWTPEPGDYTVTATPYSERGARGKTGKPVTLRFRVVEK